MIINRVEMEDAEELLSIYAPYVKNTAISFEYEIPTVEEFMNRISHISSKYPYIKAVEDGKIMGYAYANTFKGRKAYDWSVETSIYVKANSSRKGVGTLLYNELERYLKLQNIINVNACITYPNEKSENFHKKFGYKTVGHFTKCGYKFGQWNDMIWMEKFIGEHTIPPKAVIPFSELNLK